MKSDSLKKLEEVQRRLEMAVDEWNAGSADGISDFCRDDAPWLIEQIEIAERVKRDTAPIPCKSA